MSKEIEKVDNEKALLANRFTQKVLSCYGIVADKKDVTEKEKKLISGYFVKVDDSLKEQGITWKELEQQGLLNDLALSMANKAVLGLDMRIDNHLNIIPSKNKKTGKITIKTITGYKGEIHKVKQFAVIPPLDIVTELVYETDDFAPIKKSDGDSYTFSIKNPFNRGKIVGGFAYIKFENSTLNRIFTMSVEEILSRKPYYVKDDDNFWSKYPEAMYKKTLAKEACKSIDLDVNKIEKIRSAVNFERQEQLEQERKESNEIAEENTAKGEVIDVDYSAIEDAE